MNAQHDNKPAEPPEGSSAGKRGDRRTPFRVVPLFILFGYFSI